MDDKVVPTIHRAELTAIISRLEAATSRLEDMASATVETQKTNGAAPPPTAPLPPAPVAAAVREPPKPPPEALPESVEEFDSFINGPLKKFVNLSDELGGPVAEQVGIVADVLEATEADRIRLRAYYEHLPDSANSSSSLRKQRNLI
jgi:adenylyl cyclase-associated protein